MLRGLFVILAFQLGGNLLQSWTAWPVPGAILGLLLFFIYLVLTRGGYAPEREVSGQLLRNLPFFFVPAGVGVMTYADILQRDLWPILAALVGGTLIAMICTGLLMQHLLNRQARKECKHDHSA